MFHTFQPGTEQKTACFIGLHLCSSVFICGDMKIDKFLVREGSKIDLRKHPTSFTDDYTDKKVAAEDLKTNVARLAELQDVMYAQDV